MDEMNEINACVEQPPSDPLRPTDHPLLDPSPHMTQHDEQGLGLAARSTAAESTTTTALLLNNPRMSYSGRCGVVM